MKLRLVCGASSTASSNSIVPFAVSMNTCGEKSGAISAGLSYGAGAGAGTGRIAGAVVTLTGPDPRSSSAARTRTAHSLSASASLQRLGRLGRADTRRAPRAPPPVPSRRGPAARSCRPRAAPPPRLRASARRSESATAARTAKSGSFTVRQQQRCRIRRLEPDQRPHRGRPDALVFVVEHGAHALHARSPAAASRAHRRRPARTVQSRSGSRLARTRRKVSGSMSAAARVAAIRIAGHGSVIRSCDDRAAPAAARSVPSAVTASSRTLGSSPMRRRPARSAARPPPPRSAAPSARDRRDDAPRAAACGRAAEAARAPRLDPSRRRDPAPRNATVYLPGPLAPAL